MIWHSKDNKKALDLDKVSFFNMKLAEEEIAVDSDYKNLCKMHGNCLSLILEGQSIKLWGSDADEVYNLLLKERPSNNTAKKLLFS